MEAYIPLILTGLFGSGGLVALIAVIMDHRAKVKSLDNERIKMETESDKPKRKRVPLEYHPIFAALEELEFFFMYTFKYSDKGRTMIVREMCVTKIRIWRKILKEYATTAQSCYESCEYRDTGGCNQSKNRLAMMLIEGVREYSLAYSSQGRITDVNGEQVYNQASLETMAVFIPIFNEWHDTRVEAVRAASHDIPNSGLNIDCYEDYWDVLMIYLYAFVQMKYDAIGAIKKLNGQLTGREFLGVIVGSDHE